MPIINNMLTALALTSLFLMIAGLIRPSWALLGAKETTRLRSLVVFGGACLSLAAASFATHQTAEKQAGEIHQTVKGQISAGVQTLPFQDTKAGGIGINQVGATEEALLQFLQRNGFKKENSLYLHHPDLSHPLRPYVALAFKFDSKGLKSFQLDNWYSDPAAAATIPASINMKLESMEASVLTELLGNALGNTLASIRKELISSESGDVFSLTLNGRKLYGFVTSGGGSIVFLDDDSPLGMGPYRKRPKRIS